MNTGNQNIQHLMAYAIIGLLTSIFLTPFCGWMYRCGCTFLWFGGLQYCNIYQAGIFNCPWCSTGDGIIVGNLPILIIFGGEGLSIYLVSLKRSVSFITLTMVGLLAFWIYGTFTGYIYKLIYNYPHFFLGK